MRRIQYGNKNRTRNTYQEVRDAILYSHLEDIRAFARTEEETLCLVMSQEPKLDPTVVVEACPEFMSRVEHAIISSTDEDLQVPEVILRLVEMGGDANALLAPFLRSCKRYSYRMVLEGIKFFDNEKLQRFVMEETIQEGNCKNLKDFAIYTPNFVPEEYIEIFTKLKDLRSMFKLVDEGLLDLKTIDDQIFAAADKYVNFDPANVNNAEEDYDNHTEAMDNLFTMLEVIGDKADLDRIESLLMSKDDDNFMHQFVGLFQDRSTIPDYLAVKEIMNS